ncbi:disease resistance-like protein csa1 [Fagus crenata]
MHTCCHNSNSAVPSSALSSSALPNSALPSSALSNSALHNSALPSSALPNSALPSSALSNSALPNSALPGSALSSSALPHSDTSNPTLSLLPPISHPNATILAQMPLPSSPTYTPDITPCGARILYGHEDIVGFVQNLSESYFGNPDDLRQLHKQFMEDHISIPQNPDEEEESCQFNGQIESDTMLKRAQVELARNHQYSYVFPEFAKTQRWFRYQNFMPYMKIRLPPDLHDDPKWLGFTSSALCTIQKDRLQDPTISLHFSTSDGVPSAAHIVFPFSREIFEGSSKLLFVSYLPRLLFESNQRWHFEASFVSNDPGVQVDMCGMRVLYEQDVEVFVQTLVDYMLESPETYHQAFYLNLLRDLEKFQDCNHENDFCPHLSLGERRPHSMPLLLRSNETIQEECTSPETSSNNQESTEGTSKNASRSKIYLGVPLVNGQCESMTSSSLESWFKPYLQRRNSPACPLPKRHRHTLLSPCDREFHDCICGGRGLLWWSESGQEVCRSGLFWYTKEDNPLLEMELLELPCVGAWLCQWLWVVRLVVLSGLEEG